MSPHLATEEWYTCSDAFSIAAPLLWNSLPAETRNTATLETFTVTNQSPKCFFLSLWICTVCIITTWRSHHDVKGLSIITTICICILPTYTTTPILLVSKSGINSQHICKYIQHSKKYDLWIYQASSNVRTQNSSEHTYFTLHIFIKLK